MTIPKSIAKHGHKAQHTTGGKVLAFGTIEPSKPKKKRKSKGRKNQIGTTDHIPSPEKQLAIYGMVAPHREIPTKAKKRSSSSQTEKRKLNADSGEKRWRAAARRAASEARAAQDRLRGTEIQRTSTERDLAKSSMAAYQPEELPDHLKHKTKKKDWFE